ncbi:MAG: DsbA family oxidoreductase [Bdellovibrionaceae bacterium]|nr:DsbA family oxidoreductase [Pseudobdellovibrionaceae bacterium]
MIQVEIWSDIVCPFCYIGKRNFETALKQLKNPEQVDVSFRSFELDTSAQKSQTQSIYQVLAKKYGKTIEWAQEANRSVVNKGASIGLMFNMDRVIPTNSFDAHRLTQFALTQQKQNLLLEKLFAAYFTEGKDISSHGVLVDAGESVGLAKEDVLNVLNSDAFASEVREDEELAHEGGISGVPFFVFNRKYAISGAQPPESFLDVFKKIESETV